MTRFRYLLLVAVLIPLTGCETLDKWLGRDHPKENKELPAVQASQLTSYLNERATRMQSLSARVAITASDHNMPLPARLTGNLAASQPRNFRMKADSLAADVDLGSNSEQFWVYFKGGAAQKYVFASHSDFEAGKVKLPPGIVFEPDWVLQTLGMMPLPPGNQYSAPPPDQKNRTYMLSWPATLPNGTSVIKEVVFDGDPATGTKSQVKKHIVRDTKGKLICSAEIKQAKTVSLTATDSRGQALVVQYPTKVVLKWEEQKFEMDLELSDGKVNDPTPPSTALFTRPTIQGTTPVDLARYDQQR
jgi:hypothetical protein